MKKCVSFIMVLITLMLTACNDSLPVFDGVNYEYDFQSYFYMNSDIVANSEGYFFKQNRVICFFDRETKSTAPLCSKINCEHNRSSTDCNAYIAYSGDSRMWYYNGELYFVSFNLNTYRYYIEALSTDGSKRRNVCNLFKKDITEEELNEGFSYGSDIRYLMLHRGYAYYLLLTEDARFQMFRIRLTRFAKPELLYEADHITNFKGFENKIYFSAADFEPEAELVEESDFTCYAYDVEEEAISVVFENTAIGDLYIVDGDAYYLRGTELFKRSLAGGDKQVIYSFESSGNLSYDGRYFYFDNFDGSEENQANRAVLVFDESFSLVDEILLESNFYLNRFGDEYYMFCDKLDGDTTVTVAFDKSGIGTGKLERIELK